MTARAIMALARAEAIENKSISPVRHHAAIGKRVVDSSRGSERNTTKKNPTTFNVIGESVAVII